MNKGNDTSTDKFSLRKSVLIWTAGIFLGWGAAFVIVYKLIKTSVSDGQQSEVATVNKPLDPASIEPAAGGKPAD